MTAKLVFVLSIAPCLTTTSGIVLAEKGTEERGASERDAASRLQQLFAASWEFDLQENPLFSTQTGDHRANDRLPSVTEADFRRRAAKRRAFLEELREIDRALLTTDERVNYDIFKRLLKADLAEAEFRTYLTPITNRAGFHISFPELPNRVPLSTTKNYEDYIARLRGFSLYVDQHIDLMREGIRSGHVLPGVVLAGHEDTIDAHIVDDPTRSLLYEPFENFPKAIEQADRHRLEAAGRHAIETAVVPGYRKFLEFMNSEYLPAARETIAAADLPDGKAFYENRVRYFTTLDVTPEQVHAIGLKEVARIRKEMEKTIEKTGFEGSFQDFLDFLRTDDRFYADSPAALLKEAAYILKKMDGKLPELFGKLPRMPYGLKPIPDYIAPKTTTAYYNRPAGDGTRSGTYWLNTYDLKSRPLYELEALSLHEAVPGHHLQIALQQELEGLPDFRRFSGFTAFVEGWGLYAERLGLEAGFYQDPYSDFGRLTYEMWRACRLVVDTGMHYLGWTRQRAIDYMAKNTALTLHNITTEVDRYIAWPGQALAYKMGELTIRRLREKAEGELGAQFDVREFHDVVLGSGSVPLMVLEDNVNAYIERSRNR